MDDDDLKDDELDPAALIDDDLEDEDDLDIPLDDDDLEDEDDLDPTNLGKLGFGIEDEDDFI